MARKTIAAWMLLLGMFWSGCDIPLPSSDANAFSSQVTLFVDSEHRGFLKIPSTNQVAYLGTNFKEALLTERPLMKVTFSYDFSIGKSEVTCGDFNAIMNSDDRDHKLALPCENDSLPAVDVSYYDAVLYSNARSKEEGLDSAYTYGAASYDGTGHCKELEGLTFHPERNGFRLPTEAEWLFVAAQKWTHRAGWTLDNSGGKLHPVCTAEKDIAPEEACDMKGNAMEWVNDWNGVFKSGTVKNFVGAPDGGALGTRVLKGGSFLNELSSLELYRRGDVYAVTSPNHRDYIGFRLAYGKIPAPVWLNGGDVQVEKPVSILANSQTVKSRTGSFKMKLAFVNRLTKNLSYVDYESSILRIVEIQDSLVVFHPDISPDGKKVAFSTGMEGVSSMSALYVRNLDEDGSGLVKLNVENAVIPRWNVLDNGDTVIVYVTNAGINEDDETFKSGSTWQVPFKNNRFGKPVKLFDGTYHGGVSPDHHFAVTGASRLRARVKDRESIWYDGEQACNVSLSKDGLNKTLFLDFGGEYKTRKYGVHEMILEMDSTGNLVRLIPSPAGYSFDHSEWILNDSFSEAGETHLAVATLTNKNGNHEKIVLVDLKDSSVIELLSGEDLWHPCLWVHESILNGVSVDYDLDSAGVYLLSGGSYANECVRVKMELLWKYAEEIEFLLVGSSRMEGGLIPDSITAGFAMNMAHSYNDLDASAYIAENYGLNVLPNLKAIVIGIDFDLWQQTTYYSDEIFNSAPGFAYDANHHFWKDGVPDYFVDAVENSNPSFPVIRQYYYDSRGFHTEPATGWGEPFVDADLFWEEVCGGCLEWNVSRLKVLVLKAEEKGIPVVGILFPQNPGYKDTDSWGRYGPTQESARTLMKSLSRIASAHPNFMVMDEHKMGNHDYTEDMAVNTDHLAILGAIQLTRRLDSLLKTLE